MLKAIQANIIEQISSFYKRNGLLQKLERGIWSALKFILVSAYHEQPLRNSCWVLGNWFSSHFLKLSHEIVAVHCCLRCPCPSFVFSTGRLGKAVDFESSLHSLWLQTLQSLKCLFDTLELRRVARQSDGGGQNTAPQSMDYPNGLP